MSNLIYHGDSLKGLLKKAKSIIFDNTGTGLTATNTQDAIAEINTELTKIQTNLENVKFKAYTVPLRTYSKGVYTVSWSDLGVERNKINIFSITGMMNDYSIPRPSLNATGSSEAGWDVFLSAGTNGVNIVCSGSWSNAICKLLITYKDL